MQTISVHDYAMECRAKGLRGNYEVCRPDFTVDQPDYSAEDEHVWHVLTERQTKLTSKYAHRSYLDGLKTLGLTDGVPRFDEVSRKLKKLTGWVIVPVPGLIPAESFFEHLAGKRFPVTNWLRTTKELDYIVEPDMFHDFFGHVPILTQPKFAGFMQLYGLRALEAIDLGGVENITRLYWYTAEYGLIDDGRGAKAFGAGLMSSFSELVHALTSPEAKHRPLDIATVIRTTYEIDKFQRVYFVLSSFDDLLTKFQAMDLAAMIGRARDLGTIDPDAL